MKRAHVQRGFVTLLGLGMSLGWSVALLSGERIGPALVLMVPFGLGIALGYNFKASKIMTGLAAITVIASVIWSLMAMNLAGLFCGLILGGMFSMPVLIGVVIGRLMAFKAPRKPDLSKTGMSMLPLLILPGATALWETPPEPAVNTVVTKGVIEAPAAVAWENITNFERGARPSPLMVKLGLPGPLRVEGQMHKVGDVARLVFKKGQIVRRVTGLTKARALRFEVLEQSNFEDRSIRLVEGGFRLNPITPERTEVTVVTRYKALLGPRWYWEPVERFAAGRVQKHVMEEMSRPRTDPKPSTPVIAKRMELFCSIEQGR